MACDHHHWSPSFTNECMDVYVYVCMCGGCRFQQEQHPHTPLGQALQFYLDSVVYPRDFQLLLQNFYTSATVLQALEHPQQGGWRFRWRVLSFLQQFARAQMVLNYTRPLGDDVLECPIVQGTCCCDGYCV